MAATEVFATEAFAPAKVNLTLHVTGQRADGYHLLDSLVVFADVGDRLVLTPGDRLSLEVMGRFAAGVPVDAGNIVWRAAEAAGWRGHILLEKNLPHGGGLGGGSADAAALLRGCGKPLGITQALALGADVPVCLDAAPKRMLGVGEVLAPVAPVPALSMVLVNPGLQLATPAVFRRLDRKDNPGLGGCDGWTGRDAFLDWLRRQRNDLQPPACALAPGIAEALAALDDAELARMSGSGSTCFGIYPDAAEARAAAARIAAMQPAWWVQPVTTGGA